MAKIDRFLPANADASEKDARRDARRGESSGFAAREGAGKPPLKKLPPPNSPFLMGYEGEASAMALIEFDDVSHAKILVIGVGGGGGNAVNTMISGNLDRIKFVVANTDMQALEA